MALPIMGELSKGLRGSFSPLRGRCPKGGEGLEFFYFLCKASWINIVTLAFTSFTLAHG